MCSHKTDEYITHHKFYNNHKPVFVSLYIEYIVLVSNIVCRRKIISYIAKIFPLCF